MGFRKAVPVVVALAIIAIAIGVKPRKPESIPESPSPASPSGGATAAPPTDVLPPAEGSASTNAAPKKVLDLAPTPERLRADVANNPHAPPQALIDFAASLAPRMEEALKSPEKAEAFYAELKECEKSPKLARAKMLQALCLANIKTLGKKRPEFKARADASFEQADPEIARLAR